MNRIIVFLSFFLLLFLQSCVEKEGYYDYGQEKTISLLTRSKWIRFEHQFDSLLSLRFQKECFHLENKKIIRNILKQRRQKIEIISS